MLSARRETDQHQRVAHHLALQFLRAIPVLHLAPDESNAAVQRIELLYTGWLLPFRQGSQVIYTLTDYSSMVQVVWLEHTVSASQMRRDTNFAIPGYEGKNPQS